MPAVEGPRCVCATGGADGAVGRDWAHNHEELLVQV